MASDWPPIKTFWTTGVTWQAEPYAHVMPDSVTNKTLCGIIYQVYGAAQPDRPRCPECLVLEDQRRGAAEREADCAP